MEAFSLLFLEHNNQAARSPSCDLHSREIFSIRFGAHLPLIMIDKIPLVDSKSLADLTEYLPGNLNDKNLRESKL